MEDNTEKKSLNFIEQIIEEDLKQGNLTAICTSGMLNLYV